LHTVQPNPNELTSCLPLPRRQGDKTKRIARIARYPAGSIYLQVAISRHGLTRIGSLIHLGDLLFNQYATQNLAHL
jgi:hypothetical protein